MFKKILLLILCFVKINGMFFPADEVVDAFKITGTVMVMSLPIKCVIQNFLTKKFNPHHDYFKAFSIGGASLLTGLVAAISVYCIGDKIFNKRNKK